LNSLSEEEGDEEEDVDINEIIRSLREEDEEAEQKKKQQDKEKEEAEKKRVEEEKKKSEAEAAERKRKEAEDAEKKKKEIEEAQQRKEQEEALKKKKEQEELAKKEKNKTSTKTSTSTVKTDDRTTEKAPEETKAPVFVQTSEGSAEGKNFESNKGKLPAPVSSGSVVESFGRNAHPTLPDVFTNNNGVDYACSKGANVRAVFEGEVTSVFSITGAGKVVIIKHGNYRSVYSNLKETYVSIGSKVSTKQAIGSLMIDDNVSICHFEIHQVVGGIPKCLNPQLWVGR
jgi:septal ring factor EnvC (AmiA/AmiB activator)